MKNVKENIMRFVFILAACVSIAAVALICIFLFANGIPAIAKIGPLKFLGGTTWNPNQEIFGIFPMIIGSIYATAIAIIVGVPIGLLTSVFLARFCPEKLYKVLKPAVSLLAGIPSIVYGFFGLVVMVPIMQNLTGVSGKNVLTAGILLGFMILPTIIEVSEAQIRAVPNSYYEGSLALGATHERSVYFAMLPAAKSGIMAGHSGHWSCDWGNHGGRYDCRKSGSIAEKFGVRCPDDDRKYCLGNGLCNRLTPGSVDCNRRGIVCVHSGHQCLLLIGKERKGLTWQLQKWESTSVPSDRNWRNIDTSRYPYFC